MSNTDDDPIDVEAVLADPAEQRENQHDEVASDDPGFPVDPDFPIDGPIPAPDDPGEGGGGGGAGGGDQPIAATCLRTFTAVHDSGQRPLSSIRLSLGFASTGPDVDVALAVIPSAVEQLRSAGAAA